MSLSAVPLASTFRPRCCSPARTNSTLTHCHCYRLSRNRCRHLHSSIVSWTLLPRRSLYEAQLRNSYIPVSSLAAIGSTGRYNHGLELIPDAVDHLVQVETGVFEHMVAERTSHQALRCVSGLHCLEGCRTAVGFFGHLRGCERLPLYHIADEV